MAIPLTWQLQIRGAEEVKQKLSDINEQFSRGEISTSEYAKELRGATRDARAMVNIQNVSKNVFLATHPALLNLTRGMSVFGSVMRSAQSALNTFALTQILLRGSTAQTAKIQGELNQLRREEQELIDDGLVGTKAWLENQDAINIKLKELEEATNQEKQDKLTAFFGIFTGAAITFATMVKAIPEMKTGLSGLMTHLKSFGVGKAVGVGLVGVGAGLLATGGLDAIIGKSDKLEDKLKAIGATAAIGVGTALIFPEFAKFILIGTAIATATIAIIVFRKELTDFVQWVGTALNTGFFKIWADLSLELQTFEKNVSNVAKTIKDAFMVIIPNAIFFTLNFIGQKTVDIINNVSSTIINFINSLIDKINKIAKKLNLPKIDRLTWEPLIYTPIGLIPAPASLAQQGVSPATHPWLGGSGGGVVNNITVQGSIWSKEEFNKAVGESLKSQLLQRGFQ